MSGEIAKTIGIDYKKLKVGAIVQQGELSSIIESQPKEFKELLNSLIGIDRLDFAYQTMYEVVDSFRERLRDTNGGFDDKQIVSIRLAIEQKRAELKDSESRLTRLEDHRDELNNLLRDTESEIERMEPLILQGRELQATEDSLIRYLNGRRACIGQEIRRLEWLIKETHESYQIISEKEEVIINLHMIRTEIEDLENVIVQDEGENGRLRGLLECAKRMEIKDGGKCPVCGSLVPIKINKLFDAVTIQLEIKQKMINREKMLAEKVCLKREEKIMEAREKRIESAEGFLASNCINVQQDIINLESQLQCTKNDLVKIPEILIKINNPRELEIDNF
jgi:exonuclease SbcC